MMNISDLLATADAYKRAAGIERDTTVSSRVFGDSKKLGSLRDGSDITVGRFNDAMAWFRDHWPAGAAVPPECPPPAKSGAA